LATELGTAREVISRTLSEFQRREWVEQSRGEVRLVAPSALENLVSSAGTLA
jgi:CRP/FNR family transcriptional regulator